MRVVHDLLFEERVADAHDHRAEDLALGRLHVDDQTAVLHRDHLIDLDDSGLDVDRNFGHLHAANAAEASAPCPGPGCLPRAVIGCVPSLAQACFQVRLFAGLPMT